jgi:hypothetical protein
MKAIIKNLLYTDKKCIYVKINRNKDPEKLYKQIEVYKLFMTRYNIYFNSIEINLIDIDFAINKITLRFLIE